MRIAAAGNEMPVVDCAWSDRIAIGSETLPMIAAPSPAPRWQRTAVIRGLPAQFADDLLRGAQVGCTAPAWQVVRALTIADVDPATLDQARSRLAHDLGPNRTSFLCLAGMTVDGVWEPIGCAGVRRRIGDRFCRHWGVFGRVLLMPAFRGRGLSGTLSHWILRTLQTLDGRPLCGVIGETQSPAIEKLLGDARAAGAIDLVEFGIRRSPAGADRTYLGLFPGVGSWLTGQTRAIRAQTAPRLRDLLDLVTACWLQGVDADRAAGIAQLLAAEPELLDRLGDGDGILDIHADYVGALAGWGVIRPAA